MTCQLMTCGLFMLLDLINWMTLVDKELADGCTQRALVAMVIGWPVTSGLK